jgi:predicted nucleotidyltransferase
VPESDIDLLVDFDGREPTGFRYFGMLRELQDELSAIIGRQVHVVRITASSATARRVLNEAVPL